MRRAWMAVAAAATVCFAQDPPADGPDLTGWIVDAQTGKAPLVQAVVHATWVMRADPARLKAGGERSRRVAKEVNSIVGGRYYIRDWKQFVDTKGWKLVPGQDPIVRIYAPGYRRLVIANTAIDKGGKRQPVNAPDSKEWKWAGENKVQSLTRLPENSKALAEELAAWKRDIEGDIAATPEPRREAAIRERGKLIVLFDQLCGQLPAAPAGLCYAEDSPIGRYAAQAKAERATHLVVEQQDGKTRKYRIEAATTSPAVTSEPGPGYSSATPPRK